MRRRTVADCKACAEYPSISSLFPAHDPSPFCESGKHPHCTCDWCF